MRLLNFKYFETKIIMNYFATDLRANFILFELKFARLKVIKKN